MDVTSAFGVPVCNTFKLINYGATFLFGLDQYLKILKVLGT
jgi:hypothetical protein